MISLKTGDILSDPAFALVNTVNIFGLMGKGIALDFKNAFPHNFDLYRKACISGELRMGKLLVVKDVSLIFGERLIINFPTKKHWRDPSQYEYVQDGLLALRNLLIDEKPFSIAIPALGCGNGGLDWNLVKPMIFA